MSKKIIHVNYDPDEYKPYALARKLNLNSIAKKILKDKNHFDDLKSTYALSKFGYTIKRRKPRKRNNFSWLDKKIL